MLLRLTTGDSLFRRRLDDKSYLTPDLQKNGLVEICEASLAFTDRNIAATCERSSFVG
jgi:hypothetical protein